MFLTSQQRTLLTNEHEASRHPREEDRATEGTDCFLDWVRLAVLLKRVVRGAWRGVVNYHQRR